MSIRNEAELNTLFFGLWLVIGLLVSIKLVHSNSKIATVLSVLCQWEKLECIWIIAKKECNHPLHACMGTIFLNKVKPWFILLGLQANTSQSLFAILLCNSAELKAILELYYISFYFKKDLSCYQSHLKKGKGWWSTP